MGSLSSTTSGAELAVASFSKCRETAPMTGVLVNTSGELEVLHSGVLVKSSARLAVPKTRVLSGGPVGRNRAVFAITSDGLAVSVLVCSSGLCVGWSSTSLSLRLLAVKRSSMVSFRNSNKVKYGHCFSSFGGRF